MEVMMEEVKRRALAEFGKFGESARRDDVVSLAFALAGVWLRLALLLHGYPFEV